jgi:hypothetical protein
MPVKGAPQRRRVASWSALVVVLIISLLGLVWFGAESAGTSAAESTASAGPPETTETTTIRTAAAAVSASPGIQNQPPDPGPRRAPQSDFSTASSLPQHNADTFNVTSPGSGQSSQLVVAATGSTSAAFTASGRRPPANSTNTGSDAVGNPRPIVSGGGGIAPIRSAGGERGGSNSGGGPGLNRGGDETLSKPGAGGAADNPGSSNRGADGVSHPGGGGASSTVPDQASRGSGNGSGDAGGPTIIAGQFSPGASPGTLEGDDIVLLADAWLTLEVAGRIPGLEYDRVVAADELHLDGTMEIVLLDGFMPIAGDIFDFFDWGTLTGQFSNIIVPGLEGGLEWDLSSLYVNGEVGVDGPSTDAARTQNVPVPATIALLGVGLAAGALRLRGLRLKAGSVRRRLGLQVTAMRRVAR